MPEATERRLTLEELGWDDGYAAAFAPYAELGLTPARVVAQRGLNLISSGFYALARRGEDVKPMLSATTRDRGAEVEIRIRDNGTGISPDVKEKMFNPFFTTKPAGEGTGLGLSLSHDIIVKQHGGRIDVDTRPGEFTEFTILLPRKSSFSDNNKG